MALAQGAKISPENPAEIERDRPEERARWFLRGRTVDGRPAADQLHRAYSQKLNNRRLQAQPRASSGAQGATPSASPHPNFIPQPAGGPVWTSLGPAPTATAAFGSSSQDYGPAVGRVTAVVVDQSDPSGNTVLIGGASGGVWKTTNAISATRACNAGGVCTAPVAWTPLTDGEATLAVGSIALQPGNSNLILVGTGEANNSADSYYGLGILRSTNGGASWNLISQTANGAFNFHGLGFTHIAFASERPNIVVATAAGASAGIALGAESGGSSARGIYYSTDAGLNWSRANVSDGSAAPDPGSANAVIYNPFLQKFYANIRYHGLYSSPDGANWTRLPIQPPAITPACTSATNSNCPLYRAEMAIVPGRPGAIGAGEMYVWIVDNQDNDQGIFQTKDGGQTWTSISTGGIDLCGDSLGCGTGDGSQATYNITLAAVPNLDATDLYAAGVNQYRCQLDPASNPTCASQPFFNLTHVYGSCGSGQAIGAFSHVHPDEHGIDFSVSNPKYIFFGNDGGIYRTLDGFAQNSAACNGASQQQIQFDNLNGMMGSMIQFVGFSHHPADSTTLLGGTQDNGSPAISGSSGPLPGSWLSVNNGDGGFNDINPLSPTDWFTSTPDASSSGSFPDIQHCGSGISCSAASFRKVVGSSQVGSDHSSFYPFFALDPQASGRMLVATCRVWRGNNDGLGSDWASGGGTPLTPNLDDPIGGSTCAGTSTFYVNTIAAGGPCKGPCNPGITPASGTGGGSQAIWAGMEGIADSSNAAVECPSGTPCGGQVWRTLSADSGPSSWNEISGVNNGVTAACTATPSACNINPRHYTVSGIALDPKDATGNTAYVTIMGFGVGHVFKTTNAGATWARLDGDPSPNAAGLPDAPADAVIADPSVANLVYVGTDVGVFKSMGDGVWTELGPSTGVGSLPNVVVTQLKIYNKPNDPIPLRLRASTYGRGIWEISISPQPGFAMAITDSPLYAFAGQTANFNGSITTFNGYTSSINVTCGAGSTAPPSTCPSSGSPVVIAAPATSGSFTVAAGDSTVGDFSFYLNAVGADPKNVSQQVPVTLHSVDFSLGAIPAASVAAGNDASVSFDVGALGQFTGDVSLSCSGLPTGAGPCSFAPPVSLKPGDSATVALNLPTSSTTTAGVYNITITASSTLASGTKSHSSNMTLTVTSASLAFSVTATSPANMGLARPGQSLTGTVSVSSPGAFTGTLALSCSFDRTAGDPGASSCSVDPASVTLAPGQSSPATFTINTSGALATNPRVVVMATDTTSHATKSVSFDYRIVDYALTLSAPVPIVPGGSTSVSVNFTGENGFASTVDAACAVPSPLTCGLSPAAPYTLSATATSVSATATISAPAGTTPNAYSVSLNTSDRAFASLAHSRTISVAVQDFKLDNPSPAETVKAGGTPANHVINITGQGGFSGMVALTCSSGLPALAKCTFSPATVAAGGSSTLTIQTTAPSVAQVRPSGRPGAPLFAFWITLPGMAIGFIGIGASPRGRRGKLAGYAGLVLLLALLLALTACGGGGGGSTTPQPPIPIPGTPAGTYTVSVSGDSTIGNSARTNTTQITLTVQ